PLFLKVHCRNWIIVCLIQFSQFHGREVSEILDDISWRKWVEEELKYHPRVNCVRYSMSLVNLVSIPSNTPSRLNAYRNIGRVIGLALLHSEMMSLPFCRHIYKYLLNKKV
uniref:HECT domain-containing protein n=1 Tax=Amphimedon queenslandica TaxID=400682 RepID=A0A1X7TJE8_AMPQE